MANAGADGRGSLFLNCDIITLDARHPRGEALLAREGRIVAVGSLNEVLPLAGAEVERIDLGGHVVLPGLFDSHLHLLAYGLSLNEPNLARASLGEVLSRIRSAAAGLPPSAWILGRGWDEASLGSLPGKDQIEEAAGGRPCLLYRTCGHVAVAGRRALRQAGITPASPDPAGGTIDRDPVTGDPTGILRETAIQAVADAVPAPSTADLESAVRRAAGEALSLGITSVRPEDVRTAGTLERACSIYRNAVGPRHVPLRVVLDVFHLALGEFLATTWPSDEWFRLGAVKIFADGSLGARTAALSDPYRDDPGNRGIQVTPLRELKRLVMMTHRAGRQVAIHAIGDLAVANALDAIEEAQWAAPRRDPRHRLLHCQVLTSALIRRMARAEVVADVQPAFVGSDYRWVPDRLGLRRTRHAYAWRSLLEAGVRVAGSSDAPVEPLNPFYGIHAAVTRQDREGLPPRGWRSRERLSPLEALQLYTLGAAYAAHEEDRKGSLEPGKFADMVAIPVDPSRADPPSLKDIRPVLTVVGGKVAWAGGPFQGLAEN